MTNESWHQFRAGGLGSSDAPVVMGVSPWCTPYELWEEKTKRVTRDRSNWATERGNRMEAQARAAYEFDLSVEMPPMLVIHPIFKFIRASLDGYNSMTRTILEIKCPGKEDHQKALDGIVPEKYMPQLQHQLLAFPEAKCAHYYSFDGMKGRVIQVERDYDYIAQLSHKLAEFWTCVIDDVPPPLMDRDFHQIENIVLESNISDYLDIQLKIKALEKSAEHLREIILANEAVDGKRVIVGGKYRVNLVRRKGNIDYSNIPELRGVDLKKYRRQDTVYRTIGDL